MERLVELYRVSSSVWAVASLVVANLLPLVGVLFFGWDLWTIVALYWAENGIIGLYNVAKILKASGPSPAVGPSPALGPSPAAGTSPLGGPATLGGIRMAASQARTLGAMGRVATAMFFVVHYGLFWFVHGIFVLVALPSFASVGGDGSGGLGSDFGFGGSGAIGGPDLIGVRADMDLVILGAAALAISHGVAFVFDFLGRKEYLKVSPQEQAGAPYGRLVILHMTIILGAFLSAMLGVPIGALLVLVALKTALDLALHLRERRAAAGAEATALDLATPAPTTGLT